MFKKYDELLSPNVACLRHSEPESPHEGACIRYMVSRNRQMKGVFNMYI